MTNKSILITGASSGIGKYVSGILAHRGWTVWASYIEEGGEEELLKIHSKNIKPIKIDVTNIDSIKTARKIIEDSKIPLDVLYNNAGIAMGGPIEMFPIESMKKVFDINFFGDVRMIQVFLPLLRASSGRIVNMSSIGAFVRVPFVMPYSSSKIAVECMSDQLRRELKGQNVSVVIIEPGSMRTPIWKKPLANSDKVLEGDPEILSHYQPEVGNLNKMIEKSNSFAKPLSKLKNVVIHAVESPRPKARYMISRSDMLLKMFLSIMPVKLVDFYFRKYLKY